MVAIGHDVTILKLTHLLPPLPIQETDKATMDVEAQEDGVMAKILVSAM